MNAKDLDPKDCEITDPETKATVKHAFDLIKKKKENIGPKHLRFMEDYKPSCKNPKSRDKVK